MEAKLKLSSILKFLIFGFGAVACAGCLQPSELLINGRAVLEGGQPIRNGVIVITELHGRPFSMPAVSQSKEVQTDNDGDFSTVLNYKGGDLNIVLDAAPCKWSLAFVKFRQRELEGVATITPKLVAKPLRTTSCGN
jgi:hypothetical protein